MSWQRWWRRWAAGDQVGRFEVVDGGQQGIELVQVVETAGSRGLSWCRWWRQQAAGDQVGEGGGWWAAGG